MHEEQRGCFEQHVYDAWSAVQPSRKCDLVSQVTKAVAFQDCFYLKKKKRKKFLKIPWFSDSVLTA